MHGTVGVLDPFYSAAALHFDDLMARYGAPISILNLIKKDERFERILLPEFESCVRYLNQFLPGDRRLLYTHFDVAGVNKRKTCVSQCCYPLNLQYAESRLARAQQRCRVYARGHCSGRHRQDSLLPHGQRTGMAGVEPTRWASLTARLSSLLG